MPIEWYQMMRLMRLRDVLAWLAVTQTDAPERVAVWIWKGASLQVVGASSSSARGGESWQVQSEADRRVGIGHLRWWSATVAEQK